MACGNNDIKDRMYEFWKSYILCQKKNILLNDKDEPKKEYKTHSNNDQPNQDHQQNPPENVDPEAPKELKSDSAFRFSSTSSRRRQCVLIICIFVNFLCGCSASLLAPFYPPEAKTKGMTDAGVGMVFSVYQLIIFISSVLFGYFLTKIGPKLTHVNSVLCGGLTTVLFGTVHYCPPGDFFVVISFVCRSIQAVGFAGQMTATFAISSSEFPDRVATVYGIMETSTFVGYMVGPVIGGALFQAGGFGLPFYVLGGTILINGAIACIFLPNPNQDEVIKRKASLWSLVRTPMVFIPMLSVFVGAISCQFLQPTLANHLEPFGLSAILIGLMFCIIPLLVCICGPVCGLLVDANGWLASLIVLGHFICALGYFIVGPVIPFLPYQLWTVAIGLVLIGISYECAVIPTMKCMIVGALEAGFEDSIDTYGLVSGVFNSAYYLGGFVGPMLGGFFNFNTGTATIGSLNVLTMGLCFVFFLIRRVKNM